jgi:hypothetical protein
MRVFLKSTSQARRGNQMLVGPTDQSGNKLAAFKVFIAMCL